jgi:hypothetical protein
MNISPFLSAFRSLAGARHEKKSSPGTYAFLQRKFNSLRNANANTLAASPKRRVRNQTARMQAVQ